MTGQRKPPHWLQPAGGKKSTYKNDPKSFPGQAQAVPPSPFKNKMLARDGYQYCRDMHNQHETPETLLAMLIAAERVRVLYEGDTHAG